MSLLGVPGLHGYLKGMFVSLQTANTFNSTLVVHFDELLQLIFPLYGLDIVYHISYHNTSASFDLFNLILGDGAKRVEINLRDRLSERKYRSCRDIKTETIAYIYALLFNETRYLH